MAHGQLCWDCGRPENQHTEFEGHVFKIAPSRPIKIKAVKPRWVVRPYFAWYDCWVGAYFDRTHHRLYVMPMPFFGFWVGHE